MESDFLDRTAALNKGDRAVLRRAAGKLLKDADGRAYTVFYKTYPPLDESRREEQFFFAACLQCLWEPDDLKKAVALQSAGNSLSEKDKESFRKRITTLLDNRWEDDGYLALKLYRLARYCRSKGVVIDCRSLLKDLKWWNSERRTVQREWAKACIGTVNLNSIEKGEDENVD